MSEVVVVGSFKAQPGKEAEAVEAFKALVDPTHHEEGCILYALHQGTDDPRRLAFVERWASRELLDVRDGDGDELQTQLHPQPPACLAREPFFGSPASSGS